MIEPVLLSIGALAAEFQISRDVLRRALSEAGVQPAGKRSGYPLYRLRDAHRAALAQLANVEQLSPHARLAVAKAIQTELATSVRRGELIELHAHERECAFLSMAFAQWADTLPDIVERDVGASTLVLAKIEQTIDELRERLADWLESSADDEQPKANGHEPEARPEN
jgi:phage terminase Nu1 subunit (DNA packaging protein)